MTDTVKNFSSGVLTNGGAIQKIEEREARREHERLHGQDVHTKLADPFAALQKPSEEQSDKSKFKKPAKEDLSQRLEGFKAQRGQTVLETISVGQSVDKNTKQDQAPKQEYAPKERSQKAERKSQTTGFLDALSKGKETPKPKPENLSLTTGNSEVFVPSEIPNLTAKTQPEPEPMLARDIASLLPSPVLLTVEQLPQTSIQKESGMELLERVVSNEKDLEVVIKSEVGSAPEQAQAPEPKTRAESRFQKIINTNRELAKENDSLKLKVKSLLDKLHGQDLENELVDKTMTSLERAKKQNWHEDREADQVNSNSYSAVKEARKEIFNYLSTRKEEADHSMKSPIFLKYSQDPFYMNLFVRNLEISQWWPTIDAIYNAIEVPALEWSKAETPKPKLQMQPQPIRARNATLGRPIANSEEPIDRIAQHLGNMGI